MSVTRLSQKFSQRLAANELAASGVVCLRLSQRFHAQVWFRLIASRFPRPAIFPSPARSVS